MKKKIVFVAEAMLGGIRQHVFDIIRYLDKDKFVIWLIYSDLRADHGFFDEKDEIGTFCNMIRCNTMTRGLGIQDIKAYREICKHIKAISPDIVHCHSSKAGIVGRMVAKNCNIKKIYYTPNAYAFQSPELSTIKRKIYIYAERFLSKKATTKTINVSKGEMELALKYKLDKPEKFELIYNGIAQISLERKEKIREKMGLQCSNYIVGVTARCAEQKDPMTWLKIAESVVKQVEQVDFVYIGDGPMQSQMEQWINERKLNNRIHMLGFKSDASAIVGMFDIYLSTALYEGLPYSMLEAMRAGVPIIASDTVGNNEIVNDGVNGFLFPLGDSQKAVVQIMNQLTHFPISSDMVTQEFSSKFKLDVMLKKLDVLYDIEM